MRFYKDTHTGMIHAIQGERPVWELRHKWVSWDFWGTIQGAHTEFPVLVFCSRAVQRVVVDIAGRVVSVWLRGDCRGNQGHCPLAENREAV
jgi:hypothetical protein